LIKLDAPILIKYDIEHWYWPYR